MLRNTDIYGNGTYEVRFERHAPLRLRCTLKLARFGSCEVRIVHHTPSQSLPYAALADSPALLRKRGS